MIGPFVNTIAIISGGLGGALLGDRLPVNLRERMPLIFGCCAFGLGIVLVGKMSFLPVPVLALLLGSIVGELLTIEEKLEVIANTVRKRIDKLVPSKTNLSQEAFMEQITALMILFCVSGAGIFGSMNAPQKSADGSVMVEICWIKQKGKSLTN